MNHKHFRQILLSNNIIPNSFSETKLALKIVKQKEKFILEDSVKALKYNKKIIPKNGNYTIQQYIKGIIKITNQYYFLYIQISQFEAFLRTFVNHKMVNFYGNEWHKHGIMRDITDFQKKSIKNLDKPSKALNSISFGTLELIILNGSRYDNIFQSSIKIDKIMTKNQKPKYHNKQLIKGLFSIVRNARNDICHHRRIGQSIKSNPKYRKKRMSKSDVMKALEDLKVLLGYDGIFDMESIEFRYREF